jgi:hypothetical protein
MHYVLTALLCVGWTHCLASDASPRCLTVSVFQSAQGTRPICIQIENAASENVRIVEVAERRGVPAPFERTDTYISPFVEGSVWQVCRPYFEIEIRLYGKRSIRVTLPDEALHQPQAVLRERVMFTFKPGQRFTFTTPLTDLPDEVAVSYIEAPKSDRRMSVVWRKRT